MITELLLVLGLLAPPQIKQSEQLPQELPLPPDESEFFTYLSNDEVTIARAVIKGTKVSAAIHVKERSVADLLGASDEAKRVYDDTTAGIQKVEIRVGATEVVVPKSSYIDLLNVSMVAIRPGGGFAALVIWFGGEANSYEARIEFDRARVKRREIRLRGSTGKPIEETVYHQRAQKQFP